MIDSNLSDAICIWDWENTAIGMRERGITKEDYDFLAGINGVEQWWNGVAKMIKVYLFSPMHQLYGFEATFQKRGYSINLCSKIPRVVSADKVEYKDTTDRIIINESRFCLKYIPSIRYIFIGSGDKHFVEFLTDAKNKGVKIGVIIGNHESLSYEISALADEHPLTGDKMIHLFSPIRKQNVNSE
ncbi:MAG: hypothetical protein AAB361_03675 [Patescibacteria group bacterium]